MASSAISKLIAAFTLAVLSVAVSAQCNLDKQAAAKSHTESQHPSPSPNYAAWLNQDVRWIITDEERASFKLLRRDEERDQFIEQFWQRRDPTPEALPNEFKQEHYRRMAYVNARFKGTNIPAWRTDQGRIYITFGPPDRVISEVRDGPRTETWQYRQIKDVGESVSIDFVDRCQCGELVLQKWDVQTEAPRRSIDKKQNNQAPDFGEIRVFIGPQRSPALQFQDLYEIVTHKICMNLVPVRVSANQAKVTDYTTLVPITVNVKDRDVVWKEENGERWRALDVFGRISAQDGRIQEIFEGAIQQNLDRAGRNFTYRYTAPLRSGTYRIDVAGKYVAGDRKGTWSGTITVP